MSRLTGADAYSLMEAYQAVYAPQELTEEQVWEEVENWVNSLVEEGYDLSDYTWEEMYEEYLSEMGQTRTTGQNSSVFTLPTTPSAGSAGGSGSGGRRGSGSSPGSAKPAPTSGNYQSRFAGSRDAAFARAQNIKGSPVVGPRPSAAAPAARPAAAPTRPAAAPARPTATAPATPKPAAPTGGSTLDRATAAASKPAAFSPKPQSDVGAMIARSQARQSAQTPKPAPSTAAAKPTPRQARLNMEMEYDTFDTVLEHLVAEGYADTEEAALVIMANMSEEWREEILDEGKSDRPLGIMHSFARGMKQKKGEKGEDKYGQDSEGNITDKYTKMQKSKRS